MRVSQVQKTHPEKGIVHECRNKPICRAGHRLEESKEEDQVSLAATERWANLELERRISAERSTLHATAKWNKVLSEELMHVTETTTRVVVGSHTRTHRTDRRGHGDGNETGKRSSSCSDWQSHTRVTR